eukprot:scaffold29690_cov59-Attheya_sp.AAC.1
MAHCLVLSMAMNLVEKKGPHWVVYLVLTKRDKGSVSLMEVSLVRQLETDLVTTRESHLEWQKVGCWVVKMAHCLVLSMAMNLVEKKVPHWVVYLVVMKVYLKAPCWVSLMAQN